MEDRFGACVAFTQREEGGYVADPRDPGNWSGGRVGYGQLIGSNMGVGAAALLAWMGTDSGLSAVLMRDLPVSTYEDIARKNYWIPLGCGRLPAGLDLMVFDFGWNRGVPTSLDLLRRCSDVMMDDADRIGTEKPGSQATLGSLLHRLPPADVALVQRRLRVHEDGVVGPATLAALTAQESLGPLIAILAIHAGQIASYRRLNNFKIYGAGWLARTERRRNEALSVLGEKVDAFEPRIG